MTVAAAGTNISLTFVDGVRREQIPDKALPPLKELGPALDAGTVGAWRTHSNILREYVWPNLIFIALY